MESSRSKNTTPGGAGDRMEGSEMFRLVFELLISIFLIAIIRAVASFLFRSFGSFFSAAPPPQRRPEASNLPLTGELKRDPVCGTYTVAATSLHQTVNGETHYFCSPRCLDEFLATAKR